MTRGHCLRRRSVASSRGSGWDETGGAERPLDLVGWGGVRARSPGRSQGPDSWDQALCDRSSSGRWVWAEQANLSSVWQQRVRCAPSGRDRAWTPGAPLPPTRVRPDASFPGRPLREGECLPLPLAVDPGPWQAQFPALSALSPSGNCRLERSLPMFTSQPEWWTHWSPRFLLPWPIDSFKIRILRTSS